jgi:hypothetical protein
MAERLINSKPESQIDHQELTWWLKDQRLKDSSTAELVSERLINC